MHAVYKSASQQVLMVFVIPEIRCAASIAYGVYGCVVVPSGSFVADVYTDYKNK